MSAAPRLAAFGAVLALIFAGATVAGGAADVKRSEPPPGAGHGGEEMAMAAKPVRGLAVSDDGLTLELAHRADELRFRIADRRGRTVRDFDVEHTKRMHLIVVRRDMTGFQHLHPRQAADGTWSVPLRLRDAGSYRVFADFSRRGEAHTLAGDVTVDGPLRAITLPAPALRENDLAFLHVHPDARSLRFEATFPTAGRYRLFLQFRTGGRVHTTAFTQEVTS
jgi:hypothetical protein